MQSGLWAWLDIQIILGDTLWIGIAVLAIPLLSVGDGWPSYLQYLFWSTDRISGIPILERRANERWGDDPIPRISPKHSILLLRKPKAKIKISKQKTGSNEIRFSFCK